MAAAYRFIEQSTRQKIENIGEAVIVAGTGLVGHMQRFAAVGRLVQLAPF